MLKINLRLALTLLCLPVLFSAVIRANGVLDTSFGDGGKLTNLDHLFAALLIQPDHKIINFGFTGNPILIRYNENGSIDKSFNGGAAIRPFQGVLGDIRLQPDNKILVSGGKRNAPGDTGFVSIICRINPNGSPDAGFGKGGCFSVNRYFTGFDNERINGIAVLNDGKILTFIRGSQLLRLNADGTPDTAFGTDGYVTVPEGSGVTGGIQAVADGKFLLLTDTRITRVDANGIIDTSFGDNGAVILNPSAAGLVQPDGKILILGDQTRRLTSEGRPDPSFTFDRRSFAADVFPDGRIIIIGADPIGSSGKSIFVLNNSGRIIGRERGEYNSLKVLGNGKFLAAAGSTLTRFKSVTSIANGVGDMDNDEKSEISVYRPGANTFYFLKSAAGFESYTPPQLVGNIFIEDFNADFQSDLVWWTPAAPQSCYYGSYSPSNSDVCYAWGLAADQAVKGDFDGDYKTDFAIFRDGLWHIRKSSNGESLYYNWGQAGDKPVPADYDGDGITDAAIYRPSTGVWWVLRSSDATYTAVQFGISEDKPVQADYDGDGRADFAVYRPSNGVWYLLKSAEGFAAAKFGVSTDKPVSGDYDGDGLTDIAVFRPADGNWYLLQSKNGFNVVHWGQNGDVPLSTAYSAE